MTLLPSQLAFDTENLKSAMQQDLNILGQIALPSVFELDFPPLYNEFYTLLLTSARTPKQFDQYALGLPRGFAKTTFIKLFVLGLIHFTPASFIVIAASNEQKAQRILGDIKLLLSQPNVIKIFGDYSASCIADRASFLHFTVGSKSVIIACTGAKGDPRGLSVDFKRPDFILLDDAQSRECAKSTTESAAFDEWMFGTLLKAKSEKGCLTVYIGNMYSDEGCVLKKLKHSPDWVSIIVGAILSDGTSLWPELRPLESLLAEFKRDVRMGNTHIFLAEVLNNDTTEALTGFDWRLVPKWPERYNELIPDGKCIIIDPSGSKKRSDNTAILYCEVFNTIPWARRLVSGVFNPRQCIMHALDIALSTECKLICVEDIAYQDSLLFWFEEIIRESGILGISIVPINRGNKAKNPAILDMLKDVQKRDTYGEPLLGVHPDVLPDFLSEVRDFDPTKDKNKDDTMDVLTYMRPVYQKYKEIILAPPDYYPASATIRARSSV